MTDLEKTGNQIRNAYFVLYFIGAWTILWGILKAAPVGGANPFDQENVTLNLLVTFIFGFLFFVCAFLVQQRRPPAMIWALRIAIGLYLLEAVLYLWTALLETNAVVCGFFVLRALLLVVLFRGYSALRLLERGEEAIPALGEDEATG